jgi:hypothetical protein
MEKLGIVPFVPCFSYISPNGVSSKKIAAAAFLAGIKANPSPDAPWESL